MFSFKGYGEIEEELQSYALGQPFWSETAKNLARRISSQAIVDTESVTNRFCEKLEEYNSEDIHILQNCDAINWRNFLHFAARGSTNILSDHKIC